MSKPEPTPRNKPNLPADHPANDPFFAPMSDDEAACWDSWNLPAGGGGTAKTQPPKTR